MYYVYRYIRRGTTIYVGITNNMKRRVKQHEKDKWAGKHDMIMYFAVETRADAELLETYLISYYKTEKYYNISKTKKGEVSFLGDLSKLPWVEFKGTNNKELPCFTVKELFAETETRTKYADSRFGFVELDISEIKKLSLSKQIEYFHAKYNEERKFMDNEIGWHSMYLSSLIGSRNRELTISKDCLEEEIRLIAEKLQLIKEYKSVYSPASPFNSERCEPILTKLLSLNDKLKRNKKKAETEHKAWCEKQAIVS